MQMVHQEIIMQKHIDRLTLEEQKLVSAILDIGESVGLSNEEMLDIINKTLEDYKSQEK